MGRCNLSQQVGHGRNAQLLKQYTGKMARSLRQREQKVFISRMHAATGTPVDAESPGPGRYAPKTTLWDDCTSKFSRRGGSAFGTSQRAPLAKIAF